MASSKFATMHVTIAAHSDSESHYFPKAAARRMTVTAERVAQIPPHPEFDLKYRGGKTLPNLAYINCFIGGASAWKASDIDAINQALSGAMQDSGLNNVLQQYFDQPITTKVETPLVLDGAAKSTYSMADAEALVAQLHQTGKLKGLDLGITIVDLLLPSGIILTDSGAGEKTNARATQVSSLQGLGGYHGQVNANGTNIYYMIGVYSERLASGQENGVVAFAEPWKNVVGTIYHELCEVRTDPDTKGTSGWISDPVASLGGQSVEIGDTPVFEAGKNLSLVFQEIALANGQGTVPVQFMYSNFVHGPEGPISTPRPKSSETGSPNPVSGVNWGLVLGILVVLIIIGAAIYGFTGGFGK